MYLEYFQMIDRIEALDLDAGNTGCKHPRFPQASPVFEGHFPGMPLVPGCAC
jgi:3-hydroxyacyl-[acyl-carrier-protein] dehydratase